MSDETGEALRIAITVLFAGALLSAVIISSRNANSVLNTSLDKSGSAKGYVSNTNILNLQNKPRTVTDLYKAYSIYEESINSIAGYIGEGASKEFKIFYLRSGTSIDEEAYIVNAGQSTYDSMIEAAQNITSTGHMCNIDNMSSTALTEYGIDSYAELQCYITRTVNRDGYDIYFYDLRE